jgi:hypothetical protein
MKGTLIRYKGYAISVLIVNRELLNSVPFSAVYRTLANRLVCCHDIDHVTKDEHLNHNCSFSKARNSSLMMVPV